VDDVLAGMADRAAESPFPGAVFALDDPFFSAVDNRALLSDDPAEQTLTA
jgi:hypothetical protein